MAVFVNFTNAYLQQIARETMFLLINDVHEKSISDSQDFTNLHSCHMKKGIVFSQLQARNFSLI